MTPEGLLYYHEEFLSIQGEGTDAGLPCVFIRLYGCNVQCSYCDQPQGKCDRHKISVANMVSKAMSYGCRNVCITGGEPMLQWDSLYQLALELVSDYNCDVSIETNGCVKINPDFYYPKKLKFVMDVKCPSSGVSEKNELDNLLFLRNRDEVKFVISDFEDYEYMKDTLKRYPTSAKVLVSPVILKDRNHIGAELSKWILEDKLFNVRVQVQLHKVLNVK